MTVRIDRRGERPAATLTIDRPDVRNAMSRAVITDLGDAVGRLGGDGAVRALVINGAGSAFSAGADVTEFVALVDDPDAVVAYLDAFDDLFDRIEACPVPVIAEIDGPAYGGGYELAMACDLRVASTEASLCPAEINVGLVPPFERLAAHLPECLVRELCYTGRPLRAGEAAAAGVFNDVVEPDELGDRVDALIDGIAGTSRNAVAQTKRAMVARREGERRSSGRLRHALDHQCVRHPDFRQRIEAFRDGR